MRVIDCFTFFNELEVLDLRLNILQDIVDLHILVESNQTFSGKSKPLFYRDNSNLFQRFSNRIVPIEVMDMPTSPKNRWEREFHQRNSIMRGLRLAGAEPEDIILIGDVDEIPRPKKLVEILRSPLDTPLILGQNLFRYYLNLLDTSKLMPCTRVIRYEYLSSPQTLRFTQPANNYSNVLLYGGWHFTYLGGVDRIITKLEAFSHDELDTHEVKNRDYLQKSIEDKKTFFEDSKLEVVPIDHTFPWYLQIEKNRDKYKEFILDG